jgi:hypothetical protein
MVCADMTSMTSRLQSHRTRGNDQRSNTSNVDVADAYKRPVASVSVASANAARRPIEITRPSARSNPESRVTAL